MINSFCCSKSPKYAVAAGGRSCEAVSAGSTLDSLQLFPPFRENLRRMERSRGQTRRESLSPLFPFE